MSLISPRRLAPRTEEPSQPWTTARCHRLLRPLVSRITSLRREKAIADQTKGSAVKSTSEPAPVSSTNSSGHHDEPDAESGWPMPRKKRPRLTYSQRRGARASRSQRVGSAQSQIGQGNHGEDTSPAPTVKPGVKRAFKCVQSESQRNATSPGEIVVATPILRRARGKVAPSPGAPIPGLDFGSNHAVPNGGRRMKNGSGAQRRLEERLVALRERQLSKYADLEAIYRGLEALLKATTISTVHRRSGPRSFLDMCLRKVPRYVAELEAWERLDAEQSGTISTLDNIDTSAEIYNELESLGTNVGWRHLRVVVRADGLNAVRLAIEEGLLCDEFSRLLIDLCVQLGAASEAEDLITALAHRQYPEPLATESCFTQATVLQPLVIIKSFTAQTQRAPFLFRQYSMLLSTGQLPLDWLATLESERIWGLAIQGLASNRPSYDAICFIAQSIVLLCRRKRTHNDSTDVTQLGENMARVSHQTLISILGIITSMSLLGEAERETARSEGLDTRQVTIISNRIEYILRACISALVGNARGRANPKSELLYLALFLSSGQNQNNRVQTRVGDSIRKLSPPGLTSPYAKDIRIRNHYDSITRLIASVARTCGRGTSVTSHQYLTRLFKRLGSLELSQNLSDSLKAAAAFSIAQQTNNVRDLIYAESLHPNNRSSHGVTSHQQSGNTLFTGYRWDEAIGEWVAASPVMKRRGVTTKRIARPDWAAEVTEHLTTRPSNLTGPVTDSVLDTETCPDHEVGDGEPSTDELACPTNGGRGMMMKKRPRRFRSVEALTTALVRQTRGPQQSLGVSASLKRHKGENDSEKENCVRLLAKKPRHSSGTVVLGARPQGRDSLGRRDKYRRDDVFSDDELCI